MSIIEDHADSHLIGLYLREIGKYSLLTAEEEYEAALRLQKGDEAARSRLILCNMRLVVHIAKRYQNQGQGLMDLIEEGNLGLIKAVEKFDPHRNCRFSTYATWWIRQYINRSISSYGPLVRLPTHKREQLYRAKVLFQELAQKRGHDPQPWDLLEALAEELPETDAQVIVDLFYSSSLIEPLESDLESKDHDSRYEDVATPRPDYEIQLLSRDERIRRYVARLGERERFIITRRYGLDGEDPSSIKDIAEHLGLTRERIRQLQNEAMRAIREMFEQSGESWMDYMD